MSEREQKLEAALRRAFYLGEVHWQQADSESYRQNAKSGETRQKFESLVAETVVTLATPPSEWNEAIEAAAKECEEHSAINLSGWGNECAILVRALKRKEQP